MVVLLRLDPVMDLPGEGDDDVDEWEAASMELRSCVRDDGASLDSTRLPRTNSLRHERKML